VPDGNGGYVLSPTFDAAFSKWVPVRSPAISIDGSKYAYARGFDLHVVDVATGNDRVVSKSAGLATGVGFVIVLEYSTAGIYLTSAPNTESVTFGLWVVDPTTGIQHQLGTGSGYGLMSGTTVWIESSQQQLGLPAGPSPDTVTLLDLASNRTTPWVFTSGGWLGLEALDGGGYPVVNVYGPNSPGYRVYNAPNLGSPIATDDLVGDPVGDAHGIWFSGRDGLYFWTPRNGLMRVADTRLVPLGPCL
jgi:hypothetical protein